MRRPRSGLLLVLCTLMFAACGSGPAKAARHSTSTTGTSVPVTTTEPIVTTTTIPPTTTTAVPRTTTTNPASSGGVVWPDAKVIVASCINNPGEPITEPDGAEGTVVNLSGTITNTGKVTYDYIVALGIEGGSFNQGTANFQVNSLGGGQTTTWSPSGYVTNNPTQALTCTAEDVLSEPA